MVQWFHRSTVPWSHGAVVQWFHRSTVPRFHGSTVPWFNGSTVPWFHGAVVVVLLVWASLTCAAQQMNGRTVEPLDSGTVEPWNGGTIDSNYRIELHLVGGFGATRYPEPPSRYSERRFFVGYNVGARIMWHPDHLLSVGLMSGYRVYSNEIFSSANNAEVDEDLRMQLSSVPLQLAFEVRPLDIRFGAGIGVFLLLSQLEERGQITHSWDIAYGGSAWLGYAFTPAPRVRIGPDIVLQVLSDRGIANLSAMLTLQYDLVVY